MFTYIKNWLWEHIWRRRIVPRKYHTTGKGEYMIQYLLDRYINETKPNEYIEDYDRILQEKVARWREVGQAQTWFSVFNDIENYTDEQLKYFAAMNYLTTLLTIVNPENRSKYYEQVKNKDLKEMVIKIVEGFR